MTFTNEDLKRLKDCIDYKEPIVEVFHLLPALLSRLEAAELLAECLSNHEDLDPVEVTEIKNWRKAAGRE